MIKKRILVTGGTGMVGHGFQDIDTKHEFILVGSKDCDLRDPFQTNTLIRDSNPNAIIHLAARVGGVKGNDDYIADFYKDNILINTNLLNYSQKNSVPKVVSLLSTCVYPDKAEYPLTPDQFHSGRPHSSNFGYAYAKRMVDVYSRALRKQYGCNYICAVPNNLYGLHDNFDLENGHVIPAIIRKVYDAVKTNKVPTFWGTGEPLREFTYASDISKILFFLLENYNGEHPINIGLTQERSIKAVVESVCSYFKYDGEVIWDDSKPSGQLRKPSSNEALLALGWKEQDYTSFDKGIKLTCDWFVDNYPNLRGIK
jgi:GDP-L-fucose synthase